MFTCVKILNIYIRHIQTAFFCEYLYFLQSYRSLLKVTIHFQMLADHQLQHLTRIKVSQACVDVTVHLINVFLTIG